MVRIRTIVGVLAGAALLAPSAGSSQEGGDQIIRDGARVAIEYTVKLEDGSTAITNVGGQPLVFVEGKHQILPALERALAGLQPGDTKVLELTPEQAYGNVDPKLVRTIPLEQVPEQARQVGAQLVTKDEQGVGRMARVREVRDGEIVLDLNHPLAGKKLRFEVRVLEIAPE